MKLHRNASANVSAQSWIPFTIFIFLIIIVGIGWWRSQNSIDMSNANPTQITDSNGNNLITDTRVLESDNAIFQLGVLLQSFGARNPLPEPEGLVNENGERIPDTKDKAKEVVEEINSKLSAQAQDFFNSTAQNEPGVLQDIINPPSETDDEILIHNQPDSDNSA